MRFLKKYKNCIRSLDTLPKRVLRFKRTKWKKIQKKYNLKKNFIFFKNVQNSIYKVKTFIWKKTKLSYKNNLRFKYKLKSRCDWSLSIKKLEKKKKIKILSYTLMKMELRIDILLWKLGFFKTSYNARQYIQNGYIFLNNKKIFSIGKYLKYGDIIEVKMPIKNLNFLSNKEIKYSFAEIDYYTNTIIILKSINMLNWKDFTCNIKDSFSEYEINNLILKK